MVEISLLTLRRNIHIYKSKLPEYIQIIAVVKVDAYGHCDTVVVNICMIAGSNTLLFLILTRLSILEMQA